VKFLNLSKIRTFFSAYLSGKITSDLFCTIFEGAIENNLAYFQNTFQDPGITKEEAMVSVFGHEAEHDLNKKDIAEIKGRYEGKGVNYNVDEFDPVRQRYSAAYQISIAIFAEIP
jgi:hypothetical protein